MPSNQQLKIFRPLKNKYGKNIRKIILATNIAETSLTIKNIKYIIDSGFFKMRKFYPKLNIDTLKVTQKLVKIQLYKEQGEQAENQLEFAIDYIPKKNIKILMSKQSLKY